MKRIFIAVIAAVLCAQMAGTGECANEDKTPIDEFHARQSEFGSEKKSLDDAEKEIADVLNAEIDLFNEKPSFKSVQKIEHLKFRIIENLQEQIVNDRSYIEYLEAELTKSFTKEPVTELPGPPTTGPVIPGSSDSDYDEKMSEIRQSADELMDGISHLRFKKYPGAAE